jgi:hypothetical protein
MVKLRSVLGRFNGKTGRDRALDPLARTGRELHRPLSLVILPGFLFYGLEFGGGSEDLLEVGAVILRQLVFIVVVCQCGGLDCAGAEVVDV